MINLQIISSNASYQISYQMEQLVASLDGHSYPFEWEDLGGGEFHLRTGTGNYHVLLIEHQPCGQVLFQVNGHLYLITVRDEQQQLLNQMEFGKSGATGITLMHAPMPGKVLQVLVDEGARIREGDPLIILEAMKMENELRASGDGRIETVHCRPGASVEKHQTLVTIRKK